MEVETTGLVNLNYRVQSSPYVRAETQTNETGASARAETQANETYGTQVNENIAY